MKTHLLNVAIVLGLLTFLPASIVQVHGVPAIAVEPAVVAAGSQITITGTEMEPGESFTLTLEGLSGSIPLGNASAISAGDGGGFIATFTVPAKTTPGSYAVTATAEDGDTTATDLTVTAPSDQASVAPAMAREPTGASHQIDRSKPAIQVIAAVALIAVSAALGFVLVRSRG